MPPGAGRGGAPSGCNIKKNSKLSNKNKQILTRNERMSCRLRNVLAKLLKTIYN